MKKILIIAGLFTLLLGGVGWYATNHRVPETVQPTRGTVVQAVYATGEVEPVYWSKIATQIAGKVETVLVEESDAVRQGQPLLKLDDLVECTKASEYLAHLHYLEKEKGRYKALSARDFASKSKYDHIVSEYQATKAQLDAQNEVVGRMLIKSTVGGVGLKREVKPGETITLSDVVFWVGKLTPLSIIAEVDEEDIALVKVGQTALIKADAFPDTPIEGIIHDITPKGDPVDKNFRVRISLG